MTTENPAKKSNATGARKPVIEVVLTGTGKTYYACDPNMKANLQCDKNGSTVRVAATISEVDPLDSANFVSLETAAGPANITNFLGGDQAGFSGFEIDITTFVANVTLIINNYTVDETAQ